MSDNEASRGGYEAALALVRDELAHDAGRPNLVQFESALERAEDAQRHRAWVAVIAFLGVSMAWIANMVAHPVVGACPRLTAGKIFEVGLLPILSLLSCAVLVWRPHVGAQMFVRACCWSYLVVSTFAMAGIPGALLLMPWSLLAAALGSGTVLLVLGDRGLEPERYQGVFVPAAHRVTLTVAMILAMADLQALLAINQANHWSNPVANLCALGMLSAVLGLYRLRAWGLWLNLVMNVLVAALALDGDLLGTSPRALEYMFVLTTVAQLGLVFPLVRSIIRGQADEHPRLMRLGYRASRVIVSLIMLLAVGLGLRGPDPEQMARRCDCSRSNGARDDAGPPRCS